MLDFPVNKFIYTIILFSLCLMFWRLKNPLYEIQRHFIRLVDYSSFRLYLLSYLAELYCRGGNENIVGFLAEFDTFSVWVIIDLLAIFVFLLTFIFSKCFYVEVTGTV